MIDKPKITPLSDDESLWMWVWNGSEYELIEDYNAVAKAQSFNGDRGAAGRYAAQVRWGKRSPTAATSSAPSYNETMIADETRTRTDGSSVRQSTFTFEDKNGEKMTMYVKSQGAEGQQNVEVELRLGSTSGLLVGSLTAYSDLDNDMGTKGKLAIQEVSVHSKHKRKGYATAMMRLGSQYSLGSEKIVHSSVLTDQGAAFAAATKAQLLGKASFNGDRSAAAAYAARIRWGTKTENNVAAPVSGGAETDKQLKDLEPDSGAANAMFNTLYSKDPSAMFSEDELDSVLGYVSGSAALNSGLRKGGLDRDDMQTVYDIDNAIAKAPRITQPVLVYRGIDSRTDWRATTALKEIKVGESFDDAAFCSTSTVKSVAQKFTDKIMFEIALPTGVRALPVKKLGASRLGFGESEVLLPREYRMKVLAKRTEGDVTILRVTPKWIDG